MNHYSKFKFNLFDHFPGLMMTNSVRKKKNLYHIMKNLSGFDFYENEERRDSVMNSYSHKT